MAGAQISTGTVKTPGQLSGDAAGNAIVTMSQVPLESGYVRPIGEVDAGRVTGAAFLLAAEVSEDFRARVELDSLLDAEKFNYIAQNTGKHLFRNTTMTGAWTGTGFTSNASGITTTTTGVLLQSRQYFALFGGAETYAYFSLAFTGTLAVTNKIIDIGLFTAGTATPYAPTDGVFIRATSAGLFGVVNINGVETTSGVFKVSSAGAAFAPTIGTAYDFIVTMGENAAVFWCDLRDGNGYTQMARVVDPPGSGTTMAQQAVPFSLRDANTGTTSAVQGVRLVSYAVTQGGFAINKPWSDSSVGMGGTMAQGQSGQTQGSTAAYTNNLAAGAGVALLNTAAAVSGLGGQVSVLPTLAAGTDGILCSYQNPAPTANISGRQMLVTGVRIQGVVTTALVGNATPVVLAYTLGFGHTAVSRATAEAATTKAPRILALGIETYAAAAALGTLGQGVVVTFPSPIPINPGEFIDIAAKNIGVVTTTGVITFEIAIIAHIA